MRLQVRIAVPSSYRAVACRWQLVRFKFIVLTLLGVDSTRQKPVSNVFECEQVSRCS